MSVENVLTKPFVPSIQQADFFNWILTGEGSCILQAVAGAGKTTTLVEALKIMSGTIFFGAYNKKIAEEIKTKAAGISNVAISTFHAAGLGIWTKAVGNVKIDGNKCRDLYRRIFGAQEHKMYEGAVTNLVSYAKQAAFGVEVDIANVNAWGNLIDHFNVECHDNENFVIEAAQTLIHSSIKENTKIVDFDDMIFAPLYHNTKCTQYDWILIDEAQDTNVSRRLLALKMMKSTSRLVAVGDVNQAIYGFTGADAEAMNNIKLAVNAIDMPLTVSYRCPKNVVKEAQKYVNHIQAHESAIDGSITYLNTDIIKTAKVGDAILCRFNAPLFSLVFSFIAEGIPAKIEGREIGTQIKTLVRKYKSKNFATLIERIDAYRDREVTKLRENEKEMLAVALEDKVACIKVIIDRVQRIDPNTANPVERVCQEIDTIFDDNINGGKYVILSTIHKAKGREWENVFWIQTGKVRWAKMDWELQQEKNLCYVAVTRSQKNLYLVNLNKKVETKDIVDEMKDANGFDEADYELDAELGFGVLNPKGVFA